MKHRNAHYWNWFVFFGIVYGGIAFFTRALTTNAQTASVFKSDAIWFLVTGVLGIILGGNWLNSGKLARPYDFIIGAIFALVGLLGILQAFGVHLLSGLSNSYINSNEILGLSLGVFTSLVHAVLGFTSLNH